MNAEYIIDNTQAESTAKIEITSIKEIDYNLKHFKIGEYDYYNLETTDLNAFDIYKIIRKDFQSKRIRSYTQENIVSTKIYISETTYNLLKEKNNI